jgi:hypothetical protein
VHVCHLVPVSLCASYSVRKFVIDTSLTHTLARSLSLSIARSLARSLSRSLSLSLSLYLCVCECVRACRDPTQIPLLAQACGLCPRLWPPHELLLGASLKPWLNPNKSLTGLLS